MKFKYCSLIFLLSLALNLQAQQNLFRGNNNYVTPIAPTNNLTNGLVLSLDAGNTTSYSGSGTTWNDLSGKGNRGTLVGGVVYDNANGGSLVFDGLNDYVDFTNNSSLQITEGTISAWINATTGNNGYRSIITKGLAWGLFVYDNNLITYDWGTASRKNTGLNVGNNTWNYVSMSFTQTIGSPSDNAIIYLNGIAVLTTTIKHLNQNTNVQIGANTTSQFFNGKIAQASIYNRVLTAAEILQNFNATKMRYRF